jgi:hypothetical protein
MRNKDNQKWKKTPDPVGDPSGQGPASRLSPIPKFDKQPTFFEGLGTTD